MDIQTVASEMYPSWLLGISIILLILWSGQKHHLRVNKEGLKKWARLLFIATCWKVAIYKVFAFSSLFGGSMEQASFIPISMAFTVFWEDAVFGLPLMLLRLKIGNKKWPLPFYWLYMAIAMAVFGSGHTYQGIIQACMLSFYVPLTVRIGKKHGFGTVMIGHMMYDLVTLTFMKIMYGG